MTIGNLRILYEIASDGLVYNNLQGYSAVTKSSQHLPINLKSDIVEQVFSFRASSPAFVIFNAAVTPDPITIKYRAVSIDTIALINTNLTHDAVIRLHLGYAAHEIIPTATHSFVAREIININATRPNNEPNIIHCLSLPTQPYAGLMLEIYDPLNPDEFVYIGRFIAGLSLQLSNNESYEDEIRYSEQVYADIAEISGYNRIANYKTTKRKLELNFSHININKNNFRDLMRYIRYVKTTKKALIIPDWKNPYMFSVYSKLVEMPEFTIKFIDGVTGHASFTLKYDESL